MNQKHFWLRKVKSIAFTENAIVLIAVTCLVAQSNAASVALCYAYEPDVTALSNFDWAVVDPDANFEPFENPKDNTSWFAYMSVGEVQSHRSYFSEMPSDWFIGNNSEWTSFIIDQTVSGWPSFFVNKMIRPLWNRGYKGFFLDTLDSYQRVVTSNAERKAQQIGLSHTILALNSQFPNAKLIFNRGFEIMSSVHQASNMVAFESLFSGWNQAEQKYVSVNRNDREWLLARAREIQSQYALPVLAIEYCLPGNVTCAQTTSELVKKEGIVPYVTDSMLQTVGVGSKVN